MSRDPWLKQLRIAGADTRSVEEVLAGDVPADGLQHAGSALLRVERSDTLAAIAHRLIEALGQRNWIGDPELIVELEHYVDRTASDLTTLPVALDELGEALDQSGGSDSFIDLTDGTLWPAQLFDVDQGPADFDPAVGSVAARGRPRIRTLHTTRCSDSSRRSSNRISHRVSAMRLRGLVHSAGSRPNSAGTRTSTHAGTGSVTMPAWAEHAAWLAERGYRSSHHL